MRYLVVPYNAAHTLALYLPERPDSGATWVVKDPDGSTLQSGSITRDTVDTTLSASANVGATSVTVTSATGIVVGRQYQLAGGDDLGGETVTVRAISGTAVSLARPLRVARASGVAFAGHRVTATLTAIATPDRDYRIEITYAVSSATRDVFVATFDVSRYTPISAVHTMADIEAFDPQFAARLPRGTWFPELREAAWVQVLHDVGASKGPADMVGSVRLTIAHAYKILCLVYEAAGQEYADTLADKRTRYQKELDTALAASAFDDDQDGSAESHERFYKTFEVVRG